MPGVIRLNDINDASGAANSNLASTVFVNGLPCAVVGTVISPHAPWGTPHPPHDSPTITTGIDSVLVEGKPIATVGSQNSCGPVMVAGSSYVRAG